MKDSKVPTLTVGDESSPEFDSVQDMARADARRARRYREAFPGLPNSTEPDTRTEWTSGVGIVEPPTEPTDEDRARAARLADAMDEFEGVYRGRAGQLRRRRAGWLFDRDGIHTLLGAVVGLYLVAGVAVGTHLAHLESLAALPVLFGAVVTPWLTTWLFLRYEETEDAAINDQAYRDIGGYLAGFTGVALVGGCITTIVTMASRG